MVNSIDQVVRQSFGMMAGMNGIRMENAIDIMVLVTVIGVTGLYMESILKTLYNKFKCWYHITSPIELELHKIDGVLHKSNGPAAKTYNRYAWYRNGSRHRFYGAAVHWDANDKRGGYSTWWINGKNVKSGWDNELKNM